MQSRCRLPLQAVREAAVSTSLEADVSVRSSASGCLRKFLTQRKGRQGLGTKEHCQRLTIAMKKLVNGCEQTLASNDRQFVDQVYTLLTNYTWKHGEMDFTLVYFPRQTFKTSAIKKTTLKSCLQNALSLAVRS